MDAAGPICSCSFAAWTHGQPTRLQSCAPILPGQPFPRGCPPLTVTGNDGRRPRPLCLLRTADSIPVRCSAPRPPPFRVRPSTAHGRCRPLPHPRCGPPLPSVAPHPACWRCIPSSCCRRWGSSGGGGGERELRVLAPPPRQQRRSLWEHPSAIDAIMEYHSTLSDRCLGGRRGPVPWTPRPLFPTRRHDWPTGCLQSRRNPCTRERVYTHARPPWLTPASPFFSIPSARSRGAHPAERTE